MVTMLTMVPMVRYHNNRMINFDRDRGVSVQEVATIILIFVITIIFIIESINVINLRENHPQDDSGSTLTMTDVSVSDSGNYSCQV